MKNAATRTILLATVSAIAAISAHAQDSRAIPANTPDKAAPAIPQEVVVTARRRAEAVSKTPMTITAITGQQLVSEGVVNANQLQYIAPSLTVSQGRQGVELTIRGVTTTDQSTKGEPDIAFNIDGVPNLRSEEQGLALFDLQRVEVLNGPQSTLYGVASTGGDINVITNAPGSRFAASETAEVGNYGTGRVQAMVNIPINEMFSARAAMSYNGRDGYVKLGDGSSPNAADEDNLSGRISVLGRFSNDFTIRITNTGGTLSGVGQFTSLPIPTTGDGTAGSTLIGHAEPQGYANPYRGFVNDQWNNPTIQADDALGPVHLALLSSYNYYREDTLTPDYVLGPSLADDGTAAGANNGGRFLIREKFQTYFEEARISNQDPSDRIQYILGGNFLRQLNYEDGHGFQINPKAPSPVLPDFSTTFEPLNTTIQRSYSVFLHTVTTLLPGLHLTLGGRESWDTDNRDGTFAIGTGFGAPWPNSTGTPCVGLQACIGVPDSGRQSTKAFTYNTGLDYRLTPSQIVYVSASRGYKPGGFNDPSGATGGGTAPYGPEKLYAYEVGYKLSLPSGIRLTSDFFYYDYTADQISEFAQFEGAPPTLFTSLHPTTEYGSENAFSYPLTPNDLFTASADFLRGTYSAGNGPLTGQTLSNMPAAVVGASFTHVWPLASGAEVKLYANTRWSSNYLEDDIGNNVQIRQPSFTRSNASVSYVSAGGRFTVQAFVNNLENDVQFTSAAENIVGDPRSVAGEITTPRFYGVRETVNF